MAFFCMLVGAKRRIPHYDVHIGTVSTVGPPRPDGRNVGAYAVSDLHRGAEQLEGDPEGQPKTKKTPKKIKNKNKRRNVKVLINRGVGPSRFFISLLGI